MSSTAREALLDSAGRMFYDHGITATGIDAVVRTAGVTKPTLYAHFGSKSELVAAVLQRRFEQRQSELTALLDPLPAAEHPLAVLDWFGQFYARDGDRGCGFLNACVELADSDAAARTAVQSEKAWLQDLLTTGCAAAGCPDPQLTGSQLLLLIDGVAGRAVVAGRVAARTAAEQARLAAEVLLSAGQSSRHRPAADR